MNLIKYSAHLLNLSHHTWFYSLTKYDIWQVIYIHVYSIFFIKNHIIIMNYTFVISAY